MTLSDSSVTPWQPPKLFSRSATGAVQQKATSTDAEMPLAQDHQVILEQQIKEGFDKGYEEGYRQGREAGEKQISEKADALDQILANLSAPLSQVDQHIAKELIQLSVKLAETVIHQRVELQPEMIQEQVSSALATLSRRPTAISIRLNPEDAQILQKLRPDTIADASSESSIDPDSYRIIADEKMHRGGCILKTPTTTVDATIEKQLRDLLESMLASASEE